MLSQSFSPVSSDNDSDNDIDIASEVKQFNDDLKQWGESTTIVRPESLLYLDRSLKRKARAPPLSQVSKTINNSPSKRAKTNANDGPSRVPRKSPACTINEDSSEDDGEYVEDKEPCDPGRSLAIKGLKATRSDENGFVTVVLTVNEIMQLISSEAFATAANRLTRPTHDSRFIVNESAESSVDRIERSNELANQFRDFRLAATSIISSLSNPIAGTLNFEEVASTIDGDCWRLIGRYVATNSSSLGSFLDTTMSLGKIVRGHIVKGMLKDVRWLNTWSDRKRFSKAKNLFFFSSSIWQPTNAVGNVINKQKTDAPRPRRTKGAVVGGEANVELPQRAAPTPSGIKGLYVFPTVYGSNKWKASLKSDQSGSNHARISEGLIKITESTTVRLCSTCVNDRYFDDASIDVGGLLWSGSEAMHSLATLRAWNISEYDSPERIQEQAGQRMFFGKRVSKQLELYEDYAKSIMKKSKEEKATFDVQPTHRVAYIANIDPNADPLGIQERLFVIKVKRPNSKTEMCNYDPYKGKGVQIRAIKSTIELFPHV